MAKIRIPYNWKPRDHQKEVWSYLENGGKRAVEVWHRRAGKDEIGLRWSSVAVMQRPGNYWHMFPEYSHGRRAMWEAVNPHSGKKRIDETFPKEIRKNTNETSMRIDFVNGSSWNIVGSDNYDAYVGSPPCGIVLSEYSLSNPSAWGFISPILEENNGWAIFPYTPRGNNHGKTMYDHACKTEGWFAQLLKASETGVFTPQQLASILSEYISIYGDSEGRALFNQEYNCAWEGCVPGAYYSKQIAEAREQGRIGVVPWDRSIEVDTFWDLGVDDSMSIWFIQPVGKQFRVIDYYENTGFGLEHYSKVLKEKDYSYGTHYLPHDANVRELSSGDVAKSRVEVAEGLGIKPIEVAERARNIDIILQVHIPAVRMILPFCWFDEQKCSRGISALEGYRAEYDDTKKRLANRPSHTWESHAADAFRTFAVGYSEQLRTLKMSQLTGDKTAQVEEWNPMDY